MDISKPLYKKLFSN